jgi:hypothetical protein
MTQQKRESRHLVFLENLIQQLHGNKDLLHVMSDEWQKSGASLRNPLKPSQFLSPKRELMHVHFSWFLPYLEPLTKESIQPFLSVLTPTQAHGLSTYLEIPIKPVKLPYFSRLFLQSLLRKSIDADNACPFFLLAPNSLSGLLDISWKHLIYLVDFLGIYDLTYEMKQIIDKKKIQEITSALTKDQRKFLEFVSKTPIKWYPPKLGLVSWNGDRSLLRTQLHQRGLKRLAYGVKHLDADTKWHLIHRFDVGRAKVLKEAFKETLDEKTQQIFVGQVEKVLEIVSK